MIMQGGECSGVVANTLAAFPKTYSEGAHLRRVIPLRPVQIPQECGQGSLRPSGIMATIYICLRQGSIRNRAYLYTGVTSSNGAGTNGAPGGGIAGYRGASMQALGYEHPRSIIITHSGE